MSHIGKKRKSVQKRRNDDHGRAKKAECTYVPQFPHNIVSKNKLNCNSFLNIFKKIAYFFLFSENMSFFAADPLLCLLGKQKPPDRMLRSGGQYEITLRQLFPPARTWASQGIREAACRPYRIIP